MYLPSIRIYARNCHQTHSELWAFWGVAKGSSTSWVAKLEGEKTASSCRKMTGWPRNQTGTGNRNRRNRFCRNRTRNRNRRNRFPKPEPLELFYPQTVTEPNRGHPEMKSASQPFVEPYDLRIYPSLFPDLWVSLCPGEREELKRKLLLW